MEFQLRQPGRAALDFMAAVSTASQRLGPVWRGELAASGVVAEKLPDDLAERHAAMDVALAGSSSFAIDTLINEFASVEHGRVARDAFEDIRETIAPEMARLEAEGPATIEADSAFVVPDYFRDVWFHRTTGGWDGHDAQGFIHGELIHRHFVAKCFPGDIFAQRRAVLDALPRSDYRRVLEIGTSSGHYTVALQRAFPEAQITGLDISLPMLRQALRVANENGWNWRLLQRAGEDSGLEAGSFDLVTSYIIFHEMPAEAILAAFREAFRLLEPGGQVLMSDITPYAEQDRMGVWRADWLARFGGEPYWREAASMDWAEAAREAGFVDVTAGGLDGKPYPWMVQGTRPNG